MMLVKIAWRNIWRNKTRSLVVILALATGLWAGIFVSAFVNGMMHQKIDSVIMLEMSHFQFHDKDFRNEFLTKQYMPDGLEIRDQLLTDSRIREVAARTVGMMMLSTARRNGGMKVTGISAGEERTVTRLNEKIIEGEYLDEGKQNQVLVSRETATKYDVGVKSKIVLTFQDVNGEMVSAAFRVKGIFNTGNKMYDSGNIFVKRAYMQQLCGIGNGVHELAVLLKDHDQAESMALQYQRKYSSLEVLSWMDLSTGMRYMINMMDRYTVIIVGIILLALLLSILNTMLMAVLERVRELGMLMALGMNRRWVFLMILLETLFLSMAGCPVGMLLAWSTITWFGKTGIDLGGAAYGDLGFSNIIFPVLDPDEYLKVTVMVIVMALLAALIPARKALQLNPVDAIRKL